MIKLILLAMYEYVKAFVTLLHKNDVPICFYFGILKKNINWEIIFVNLCTERGYFFHTSKACEIPMSWNNFLLTLVYFFRITFKISVLW